MNMLKIVFATSVAFASAVAQAEDIDLFVGQPSTGANVLIVLDNTSNWSSQDQKWPGGITQGEAELKALIEVIDALEADDAEKIGIGLMMLTDTNNKPAGGYVRYAMRPMNADNRAEFKALLTSIYDDFQKPSEKGPSSLDYDRAMFEVFKYFGGYTSPANATTNVAGSPMDSTHFGPFRYAQPDAKVDLAAFDPAYPDLARYKPAGFSDAPCPPKNYLLFIGNGFPNATSAEGETLLPNVGGDATQIYEEKNTQYNRFTDEWARFLYRTDVNPAPGKQNVTTYTVNVYNAKPSAEQTRLLASMAYAGGGTPFVATNAEQIKEALRRTFSEILSVNSAFASASLPVSVNAQGTYLNQIFIGMFRPELGPRWYGNLKQYQFRADVDTNGDVFRLVTADKNNKDAISSQEGFITPCAESWWSTADSYWPAGYLGNCVGSNTRSNLPDGEIVEKGGAAQRLRDELNKLGGHESRKVKTCVSCSPGELASFSSGTTSITAELLGNLSMTATDRTNLIDWVRGKNLNNELGLTSPMRPSVHGDVVHSRPLAVDYGGETGVVVFYGGNDGMLRAINGNKVDTAGNEYWAFVSREHYSKFARLKNKTPDIGFQDPVDGTVKAGTEPKDYFFDGSIGLYRDGSSVWIYPTMRRGGRHVYAFNVSTHTSPLFKWKRGPNELPSIGQTWSEPKIVKVAGYPSEESTTKSPVLIMGGGYDPCEDEDAVPNTACSSPKGNRVYILDADNGDLLAELETERSVAADVAVVDSDKDGYADVAYAVDTGANVYRINIGKKETGEWSIDKIAELGCASGECGRKFLHAPEVVVGADYNTVLVGSGNRERPLWVNDAKSVANAFFMIKDDKTQGVENPIRASSLVEIKPDVMVLSDTQENALASPDSKGWYLIFGGDGDHYGEQVVTSAAVIAGVVYFSTHTPEPPTTCGTTLGVARGYAVYYQDASSRDASSRYGVFAGGGLPPSPVVGVVEVATSNPDGTTGTVKAPFVIGGKMPELVEGKGSGLSSQEVKIDISGVRGRVYWYLDTER